MASPPSYIFLDPLLRKVLLSCSSLLYVRAINDPRTLGPATKQVLLDQLLQQHNGFHSMNRRTKKYARLLSYVDISKSGRGARASLEMLRLMEAQLFQHGHA